MWTWCQALSSGGKSNSAPVPRFCFVAAPRWWVRPLRDGGRFNWLKLSLLWMSCSYWWWWWWPRRGDRDCGEPSASSSSSPQLSDGLTNRSRRFRLNSKRCKNLEYEALLIKVRYNSYLLIKFFPTTLPYLFLQTPHSIHFITAFSSVAQNTFIICVLLLHPCPPLPINSPLYLVLTLKQRW
jgi:hypothetical protein